MIGRTAPNAMIPLPVDQLAPRLAALEAVRRRAAAAGRNARWTTVLAIPVGIGLFALATRVLSQELAFILGLVIVVPPLYVLNSRRSLALEEFREGFKRDVVRGVFDVVCPGASYSPQGSDDVERIVRDSGIFNEKAEHCASDDVVTGVLGATRFLSADVNLHYIKESEVKRNDVWERERKYVTVFQGLFLRLDLRKEIAGTTFVDPERVGVAIAPRTALDPVSLEDPDFERYFRVAASDAVEARDLLTPRVREGLVRLRERARHPVFVVFSGSTVCVAIEFGRPLFEANIKKPLTFEQVEEIAELFGHAELIVAELDLNTRFRTKGAAPASAVPGGSPAAGAPATARPTRPATSMIRLERQGAGMAVTYMGAVSWKALILSALAAPLLAWFWVLLLGAFLDPPDAHGGGLTRDGALAAAIPLAVASFVWLYAAQAWWGPIRRVRIDGAVLEVTRGLLRRSRIPLWSLRTLEARDNVVLANGVRLSPELAADEREWLLYELRRALPAVVE